jgi:hypothetical protein
MLNFLRRLLGVTQRPYTRVPVFTGENFDHFMNALSDVFPELGEPEFTVFDREYYDKPAAPISVAWWRGSYGVIIHSYCIRGSRLSFAFGKESVHDKKGSGWMHQTMADDPWNGKRTPAVEASLKIFLEEKP